MLAALLDCDNAGKEECDVEIEKKDAAAASCSRSRVSDIRSDCRLIMVCQCTADEGGAASHRVEMERRADCVEGKYEAEHGQGVGAIQASE